MRTQQWLFALRSALHRSQLVERGSHLLGRQVGPASSVLAQIESIGIQSGEAHDARSRAADPDRRPRPLRGLGRADRVVDPVVLPVIGGALLAPEASCDLQSVPELLDALARRRKVVAVGAVLLFFPARADAKFKAPAGHVVQPGRDLGLRRRVPVLDRCHEYAKAYPRGVTRERGEQGPGLEAVAIGRPAARTAEEMVADPERVEP